MSAALAPAMCITCRGDANERSRAWRLRRCAPECIFVDLTGITGELIGAVWFRPASVAPLTMEMLKEDIRLGDPGPAMTLRPGDLIVTAHSGSDR